MIKDGHAHSIPAVQVCDATAVQQRACAGCSMIFTQRMAAGIDQVRDSQTFAGMCVDGLAALCGLNNGDRIVRREELPGPVVLRNNMLVDGNSDAFDRGDLNKL